MSNTKWFKTGALRQSPAGAVNADRGIIEGVSVVTVGEAKGHGVNLDKSFVESVVELGNKTKAGLKARFGHPNMCDTALGTFLGRFKNFRTVGDTAKADLFLSNTAKETPNGDLHGYVTSMAADEPDMFGTSIVFEVGEEYQIGESGERIALDDSNAGPVFVTCDSLHACDVVDEPAANDGMFSSFSGETLAGRMSQFFEDNPGVFHALTQNPEVIAVMEKHADQLAPFVETYAASLAVHTITERPEKMKEEAASDDVKKDEENAEEVESTETAEAQAVEVVEEPDAEADEAAESEDAGAEELEAAPEGDDLTQMSAELDEEEEAPADIDRDEFTNAVHEFGAEITTRVFIDGGGYEEAQAEYFTVLKAENDRLKSMAIPQGAQPGEFSEKPEKLSGLSGIFSK